jgi:3-phosphoshikimate 1-carboxyvinyltransferase
VHYRVYPSALTGGDVVVPGDKSISHRALMLASIADGQSTITGFLAGEDCLASLAALRNMGVPIDSGNETTVMVHGIGARGFRQPSGPLDMGNSGTAMRLFTGLLSGQEFTSRLVGDESLSRRPMNRVIRPLAAMGARISSNAGMPPLTIHGGGALKGIDYALPVASAQVKSAILLAGLYAEGKTTVAEPAVTRDHTERMLMSMGVRLESEAGKIGITGGQKLRATDIQVPADLSSATFLILASLVSKNGELVIKRVGVNPTRTGVIDVLRQMGARIDIENEGSLGNEPVADLRIRPSSLRGIDVDPDIVSLAIDEFPVLFVAAAVADGKTSFTGVGELRVKESDRIATMATGLRSLGIRVNESDDGATVRGGRLSGGTVDSHGDHRIAMAFAVAATVAREPVTILNTQAVATSFPGFVDSVRSLGVRIDMAREGCP